MSLKLGENSTWGMWEPSNAGSSEDLETRKGCPSPPRRTETPSRETEMWTSRWAGAGFLRRQGARQGAKGNQPGRYQPGPSQEPVVLEQEGVCVVGEGARRVAGD